MPQGGGGDVPKEPSPFKTVHKRDGMTAQRRNLAAPFPRAVKEGHVIENG